MLWQEFAVSCPAPTYPCPCTRMPHTYIQGEFVPWFVRCAQGYKWPPKPNQQNWQKNGIKLPKNYSICIGPYIGYLSKLRLDVQLPLISSHPNARHIHERGKFLMICAQGHKWLCKPNQQNGQETQRQTTTKLVVTTVEGKILTKRPKINLLTPELSEEKAPAWHLQAARLVRRLISAIFNSPALVL